MVREVSMSDTLAYKMDTILEKVTSLEKRIDSLESKMNQLMQWKAVQDRMWEEKDKMNGNVSSSIASIESKLDSLRDEFIELKTAHKQHESDQNKLMKKTNILLSLFAGLMMLGTLIVQIVMAAK